MNGDLPISELLSASYHHTSNILVTGAQDNGAALSQPSEVRAGSVTISV